jgi:putative MATE family efflux protein
MFRLGWPVMVASLLQTMYTLADTFWLGQLASSKNAVAALQISWPIIFFLLSLSIGFGSAGVALVSQYTGAGKQEEAEGAAGQVISLSLMLGSAIALGGFLLSPLIVGTLGLEAEVSALSEQYMRIIFVGIPFTFGTATYGFLMRAYGDSFTPMIIEGMAVGLNIIVDPLLIYGVGPFPELGVPGAALATVLTQTLSAVIGMALLFKGKVGLHLKRGHLRPHLQKIKMVLRIGVPASIGHSATGFGFFILMYVIALLPENTVALAAYGVGDRIINLIFITINGIGEATCTMVGQSLGAGDRERAGETVRQGTIAMFMILSACALTVFVLREQIVSIFINDGQVVAEGKRYLYYFLAGVPFYGIFSGINAAFRGSGHNIPSMALDISRLWVLRIPLTYTLGITLGGGPTGVWTGMALSNIIGGCAAIALFKTGIWKRPVIDC